MRPERVSFSSYPGSFRVLCYRCDHIECTCTEVTFELKEILKRNTSPGRQLRISIRVDVAAWRETDPPHRPPRIAAIVSEFLQDYPEHERQELKDWYRQRQQILRRLDEYRIDPANIETGRLIGFREILAPLDDGRWLPPLGEHVLDCSGAVYIVEERYCPNPACSCSSVHLTFRRCRPAEVPGEFLSAERQFEASISLDGEVALGTVCEGSPEDAQLALATWHKGALPALKDLRWRFEKIREIARRSLPTRRDAARPEVIRSSPRVGRNDPCPCGSGKKYKKCCARDSAATST